LNVGSKLSEYLHRLATHRDDGGWPRPADDGEAPLRSELFSADQMEQHGRILAAAHALAESWPRISCWRAWRPTKAPWSGCAGC
jgi:hypothetical protein